MKLTFTPAELDDIRSFANEHGITAEEVVKEAIAEYLVR